MKKPINVTGLRGITSILVAIFITCTTRATILEEELCTTKQHLQKTTFVHTKITVQDITSDGYLQFFRYECRGSKIWI